MYLYQQSPQARQPDWNHTDSVEVLFVVQQQELYWFTFINREMLCDSTQNRRSCLSSLSQINMEEPVNQRCHMTWRFQFNVIKPMLWNPTGNALTFSLTRPALYLLRCLGDLKLFVLKYKVVDNFAHDISSSTDIFVFFCHSWWDTASNTWTLFVFASLPDGANLFPLLFAPLLSPSSTDWDQWVVLFRTLLSRPFLFFMTLNIGRQLWLWYVALFFMTCPDMAVISTYCKLLCHTWWSRVYVCAHMCVLIDCVCLVVLLQAVQDLLISKLHPQGRSVSCKSYNCSPTLSPSFCNLKINSRRKRLLSPGFGKFLIFFFLSLSLKTMHFRVIFH